MDYLVFAVVLVGALAVLNLLLTFGVVRRLREHSALFAGRAAPGRLVLEPGRSAEPFLATTTIGEVVSAESLPAGTLLAVLSTDCAPCREQLAPFAQRAAAHPGGRDRVLAVVVGEDDTTAAPFVAALAEVARVVREPLGGPVARAFSVTGYPAFALLDAGTTVLASGNELTGLPLPAPRSPHRSTTPHS